MRLQDVGIKALTIHGRTRAQMYKGSADWTLIREIKKNPQIEIPIFGNGDIDSPEKAAAWRMEFGVDGMMIGRAAIGYPWIFREIKHYFETGEHRDKPTFAERIDACRTHLIKSIEWKGPKTGVFEMRRHYSNYFKGIENFKEYRMRLVTAGTFEELAHILHEIERNPRFENTASAIEI
jgi:tRNA-dihydrouridine synthase